MSLWLWPWSWCVRAVWCGTLKTVVCRFKTTLCARSRRPRVCLHHAHMLMLKHMCAWCRCTRGRFERTHRDVLNLHTGAGGRVIVSSAHQNLPTLGYHVLQRFTKETLGYFLFSSWRISREQHVPDPPIIRFT